MKKNDLIELYLSTIFNKINNHSDTSMNIVIAGQFRFYLEEYHKDKLTEYLYRITENESIVDVILDISKDFDEDDDNLKIMLENLEYGKK